MRQNPFVRPPGATPPVTPVVRPSTLPVSPLTPPLPTAIPADPLPTIKPTDLSGCVAWLETHTDGTIVNQLAEQIGIVQTIIASSDPTDPERGVLVIYNRHLTESEIDILSAYITGK